jgi:hypothetical protein
VLASLDGNTEVYVIEADPTNADKVILRWLTSESVASAIYGADWADYVVNVKPAQGAFTIGDPIRDGNYTPVGTLRSRASLNSGVRYEIYIINPDGERRFAHSKYAHITVRPDGTSLFGFEDKTDNDFNDVVMDVDTRHCLSFAFSVLPLEAAYHHKIGVQIFYDEILKNDVILSQDSHLSVNQTVLVDVTNVATFQSYEVLSQPEAQELGYRTSFWQELIP